LLNAAPHSEQPQPQYAPPVQPQAQPYNGQPPYGQPPYAPPVQPQAQPYNGQPQYGQPQFAQPGKSRIAAGLLGILLGSLGVHNFYLGYTGKAVAQLLLTVIGGWVFGLGWLIAWIWGLVEGIQILTKSINADANGVPLTD
jgi:TM2 domain-containing membrane protein YozV